MMPQTECIHTLDLPPNILVLSISDGLQYTTHGLLSKIDQFGKIYRYSLNGDEDLLRQYFPDALHYLDHFWIVMPRKIKDRRILWREFYKMYHGTYERIINHSNNNMMCLQHFRTILCENYHIYPDSKILDYGCGTGLSSQVFKCYNLVGYDNNPMMRSKAKQRGLSVVSKAQFYRIPSRSFDACIAAYVLHMSIEHSDLVQIANLLKDNGVLIANFYKGIDETRICGALSQNGFTYTQIDSIDGRFGSLYVYQKSVCKD